MNHTVEPWQVGPEVDHWCVKGPKDQTGYRKEIASFYHEADARRAVAAVNACADVSIELLDQWNNAPADVIAMRAKGSSPAFLTALIGLQFAKLLAENVALREALAAWYETRHTTIRPCDDEACTHLICRALRLSDAALKKERP